MFDTDESGSIDSTELGGVMKMLGKTLSQKELRRMLKRVDTDGMCQGHFSTSINAVFEILFDIIMW